MISCYHREPAISSSDFIALCPGEDLGSGTRRDRYRNGLLRKKGKPPLPAILSLNFADCSLNNDPQSRKDAIEYYTDKVTYVQKNLEKLQETIERKQDNLQSCVGVMQMKLQEERQAEQSQTAQ